MFKVSLAITLCNAGVYEILQLFLPLPICFVVISGITRLALCAARDDRLKSKISFRLAGEGFLDESHNYSS